MTTQTSVEREIAALEERYWQAMQDRDLDTLLEMTDNPSIIAGASGVTTLDHSRYRQMMESSGPSAFTLHKYAIEEPVVRMLTDDVAVIAYKVREDVTTDGERVDLEAADASTWIRRDGNWVCTLHTESILGDPFGRDRK